VRNSNTKSDPDCHRHSDSRSYRHRYCYRNIDCYSHIYTYFDTATNAHTQNRTDAKNSPHSAAAAMSRDSHLGEATAEQISEK